jgi:hypothetical protein
MQGAHNLMNGVRPDPRHGATVRDDGADAGADDARRGPVELACRPGEQGRLCDRTAAVFDQVGRFGADAALVPAGLLYLCGKDAAHPVPSSVSTCERGFTRPVTIRGVGGHMHLLGRSIRVDLNPGTPRARLLLEIPRWNFHWQAVYQLAAPVQAGQGDVVRVTCRYDTAQRQGKPRYVLWGEGDRRDVPRHPSGHAPVAHRVRILLVSQMYPGPDAPELGTFVADIEQRLAARGHELARAVVDRRGGRLRHAALARDVAVTARRFRPDVVYAHFLVPAGLLAVVAARAPAVVTAHGQDVENAIASSVVRTATRLTIGRAAGVVAVSDWLRARLESVIPGARRSVMTAASIDRFAPASGRPRGRVAADGTAFLLCPAR